MVVFEEQKSTASLEATDESPGTDLMMEQVTGKMELRILAPVLALGQVTCVALGTLFLLWDAFLSERKWLEQSFNLGVIPPWK